MRNSIIYIQDYSESEDSENIKVLKDFGFEVFVFNADLNSENISELNAKILYDVLLENPNQQNGIAFIGIGLGAWYANELARSYGANAILINPLFGSESLFIQLGCEALLAKKFACLDLYDKSLVAADKNQKDIDFQKLGRAVDYWIEHPGYKFNRLEFERIIGHFMKQLI